MTKASSASDKAHSPSSCAPAAFRLWRAEDGTVWLARDETQTRVRLCHCFPWTAPQRFLSLRDDDNKELALIESPEQLDPRSREALEIMLVESRFVFAITSIESADPEFELRIWKVVTKSGPRQFQTKLDDWPRPLPDGGLLLRDIAGDLYHVEDPTSLDSRSRRILWAFMD